MELEILSILNSALSPQQKAKAIAKIVANYYPDYVVDMTELIQCITSGGFCIPAGDLAEKICFIYIDPPGYWQKASGADCVGYLIPWQKES